MSLPIGVQLMSQYMTPAKKIGVRWEWIGEAWKLYTSNPGAWIGMMLINFIIALLVIFVPLGLILIPAGIFTSNSNTNGLFATAGLALLLLPVLVILALVVVSYLTGGICGAAIRQSQGGEISVGDLFSGGPSFLRILGLVVLILIAQVVVGVVCSVPG